MPDDRVEEIVRRVEAALPNTGTTHIAHISEWCVYAKDAQHGAAQGAITDADLRALVSAVRSGQADTRRLDAAERMGAGKPWVARISPNGRGFRLHNSDHRSDTHTTARAALDAAIKGEDGG